MGIISELFSWASSEASGAASQVAPPPALDLAVANDLAASYIDAPAPAQRVALPTSHDAHAVVEAWAGNTLGFGFSAAGFLLPYHVGVAQALQALGIVNEHTVLAGASAGAIVAAALACNIAAAELLSGPHGVLLVFEECRQSGFDGRLRELLERQLRGLLPADAHERCSGRLQVAVSHLLPLPRARLHSSFASRDDLIACLLASCHLPKISDGSATCMYAGAVVADGGLFNLTPAPRGSEGGAVSHAVRVSAFPRRFASQFSSFMGCASAADLDIAPEGLESGCEGGDAGCCAGCSDWAAFRAAGLRPLPPQQLQALHMQGIQDAATWAAQVGFPRALRAARDAAERAGAACRAAAGQLAAASSASVVQPATPSARSSPACSAYSDVSDVGTDGAEAVPPLDALCLLHLRARSCVEGKDQRPAWRAAAAAAAGWGHPAGLIERVHSLPLVC